MDPRPHPQHAPADAPAATPAAGSGQRVAWAADPGAVGQSSSSAGADTLVRMVVSGYGSIISATAVVFLAGYVLNLPWLVNWGGNAVITFPGALLFLLTGSAFIALGLDEDAAAEPKHYG